MSDSLITSTTSVTRLTSPDGHAFDCFEARAAGPARGAVVVLQEVFGVNHHIRSVCERIAGMGYDAYAPALFDRIAPKFEAGYGDDDRAKALKFLPLLDWPGMVADTLATVGHAQRQLPHGAKVAAMGFCLGASVAWMAAQQCDDIDAVVGYYGGHIAQHLQSAPKAATLLHYGQTDHTISMDTVEAIRRGRPEAELHVYPAGHGFNCDERASFEPASAALAWGRSMQWLQTHVG